MKYDLSKKMTRGAKRTLADFSSTMFQLISVKPFEAINVNELCTISNYPRATFYNYFDDKFDLLNYCWQLLSNQIHLNEFETLPPEKLLHTYFDRAYDLLVENQTWINQTLKNNNLTETLINSFTNYLKIQMREIFYTCINRDKNSYQCSLPIDLLADHYSNTILLVLEWVFFKQNITDKEQAHTYLSTLLENNTGLESKPLIA